MSSRLVKRSRKPLPSPPVADSSLTDRQLVILSRASQHPCGIAERGTHPCDAMDDPDVGALVRMSFLAAPEGAGPLSITPAGLTAIGVDETARPAMGCSELSVDDDSSMPAPSTPLPTALHHTRRGGTMATAMAMLERSEGMRIVDLCAATGWLPHSARAVVSGLRKKGYAVQREQAETGSVYRIIGSLVVCPGGEGRHDSRSGLASAESFQEQSLT